MTWAWMPRNTERKVKIVLHDWYRKVDGFLKNDMKYFPVRSSIGI
jgi:hypothetical protein